MATELEEQLLRENKILRDRIADLLTQKVELERQLEDLARDRTQTGMDEIVAAVARSVRDADAALVAQAGAGPRFTIGEVDATFRGTVIASPAGMALRLPVPEHGVQPGHLGSVRMAMRVIPPAVREPAPVIAIPPSPDGRLRSSLERVQVTFSQREGAGKAAAQEIVSHATALLSSPAATNDVPTLTAGFEGIASGLTRSAKALTARAAAREPGTYREAAKALQGVSRTMRAAQNVSDTDKLDASGILDTLTPEPPKPQAPAQPKPSPKPKKSPPRKGRARR